MSWKFFTINLETQYNYLGEVFEWYQTTPNILKASWDFEGDCAQFISDLKQGLNFAGILNDNFCGMIHGEPKDKNVVEGHLFCLPGVNKDFLTALITYAKCEALKVYGTVLTQIPRKHRAMVEMNKRAGFIDTGIRHYSTLYRGKLLEIQHFIAT